MKKAVTAVLLTTIVLLGMVGCASKGVNQAVTPQYNAAVISNDFAHALGSLQTEEYNLYLGKIIPQPAHENFKRAALQVNNIGLEANNLIGTGNWNGALPLLQSALTELQALTPQSMGIKDSNSQLLYSAALNAAVATLEIKLSTAQTNVAHQGGQ